MNLNELIIWIFAIVLSVGSAVNGYRAFGFVGLLVGAILGLLIGILSGVWLTKMAYQLSSKRTERDERKE
jgi:hypothetical protein